MSRSLFRMLLPERFRPLGYLTHLTRSRTDSKVRTGPFAGMAYINVATGSAYIPKLLGIYERELSDVVVGLSAMKPRLIVDIGAAEGYYAVGLARLNPQARIVAFESEPDGQAALQRMASLNGVSAQVEILGMCETADLAAAIGTEPNPVIVCDVEGYEQQLLDPVAVPALARAHILVELHDFMVDGITETLRQRFAATHEIAHIWQQPRSPADFPWKTLGTRALPDAFIDFVVSEWRPVQMAWFWMTPRPEGQH